MQSIFIKKCFLFTVGSACRKAFHNCVERNFESRRGTEVAETTVKRLLCCGFLRIGKAMGQLCQCWWRICRERNVFSQVPISCVLRFISICGLFTDSPSYNGPVCTVLGFSLRWMPRMWFSWVVTLCRLVDGYGNFEGLCCLHQPWRWRQCAPPKLRLLLTKNRECCLSDRAIDSCSGGPRLESLPEHLTFWGFSWFTWVHQGKCWDRA
jgi:hypothetical protein